MLCSIWCSVWYIHCLKFFLAISYTIAINVSGGVIMVQLLFQPLSPFQIKGSANTDVARSTRKKITSLYNNLKRLMHALALISDSLSFTWRTALHTSKHLKNISWALCPDRWKIIPRGLIKHITNCKLCPLSDQFSAYNLLVNTIIFIINLEGLIVKIGSKSTECSL